MRDEDCRLWPGQGDDGIDGDADEGEGFVPLDGARGARASYVDRKFVRAALIAFLFSQVYKGVYTRKADVWAFGMTLYELFTRRIPFEDMHDEQVMKAVCSDDARPDLALLDEGMHPAGIAIMKDCWAAEPSERPSFDAISRQLHELAPGRAAEQKALIRLLTARIKDSGLKAKGKLDRAWDALAVDGGPELLHAVAALAHEYPDDDDNPPRQPATPDVPSLHKAAQAIAPKLVETMRLFADATGGALCSARALPPSSQCVARAGVFMLGPPIGKVTSGEPLDEDEVRETVKKIDRVHEKTLSDYEGDHRRVVDLVRASCIFETAAGLTSAIEFLKSSALLRVVRTKDRFNNPRDGCVQAWEGGRTSGVRLFGP